LVIATPVNKRAGLRETVYVIPLRIWDRWGGEAFTKNRGDRACLLMAPGDADLDPEMW